MKVTIDGYNLAIPHGTGVASYALTLARTLSERGHHVDGLFGIDSGRSAAAREAVFFERLAYPVHERASWIRRRIATHRMGRPLVPEVIPDGGVVERTEFTERLPAFGKIMTSPYLFERAHRYFSRTGRFVKLRLPVPPDIMHWTYPVPVEVEGSRNIYTVHDLVPLRLPHATTDNKQVFHALIAACVARGSHVSTVSEASRNDILAAFDADPDRVTNTYLVSPMYDHAAGDPAGDAATVANVFGLMPQSYFLFFGAIEPKKNIARLLEAYLALGTETPLVIVAGRTWRAEAELALLAAADNDADPRQAAFRKRIIRLDYMPRRLLQSLVRCARAVAFPSLSEGFGLPAHEAMLLGAPVLAGRAGSLPEVAGDAAVLVDPYDVVAISDGLRRLDQDGALRAELAVRGPAQALQFSPARYGDALETLYARVLARG